jgi:hypothetical protein
MGTVLGEKREADQSFRLVIHALPALFCAATHQKAATMAGSILVDLALQGDDGHGAFSWGVHRSTARRKLGQTRRDIRTVGGRHDRRKTARIFCDDHPADTGIRSCFNIDSPLDAY